MKHLRPGERRLDLVLLAILLLGGAGATLLVSAARNWAIMPDELVYVEQARAWVAGTPAIPHLTFNPLISFQQLYPLLISPLVAALKLPVAYPLIVTLNAWLMASAAIPAYLFANYVSESRTVARWVALCCVLTPWILFTSKVTPDGLSFAAFAWASYAILRTAAATGRASRGDLLALLAIMLAILTRNQFMLLLGVWVAVVGWSQICTAAEAASGAAREKLRAIGHALLRLPVERPLPLGVFALFALLYLVRPSAILGFYLSVSYTPGAPAGSSELLGELAAHTSALAFGLAALPVVLGLPWLVCALGRTRDRRQSDAAVLILVASASMLYIATSFDMRFDPSERVVERYIFQLAPLWFVAMGAFFLRPPKTLAGFALPALLGVFLLTSTGPFGLDTALGRALNRAFSPTEIVLIGWQRVADALGTSISGLVIVLVLILCALCWWLLSRGRSGIALHSSFALVAAALLIATWFTVPDAVDAQNRAAIDQFGERTASEKAWVEEATDGRKWSMVASPGVVLERPEGSRTGADATATPNAWRDVAFWNAGLQVAYLPYRFEPTESTPVRAPLRSIAVDWESGVIEREEGDEAEFLLLARGEQHFAPQTWAPPAIVEGFALYPIDDEGKASWTIRGITRSGWIGPHGATLRVYATTSEEGATTVDVFVFGRTPAEREPLRVAGANLRIPAGGHADLQIPRGESPLRITGVSVDRGGAMVGQRHDDAQGD